jgi:hypothetical protein
MIAGMSEPMPRRQVRAAYTDDTITVYQAYAPEIAVPAASSGRFGPPFKRDRMTWIKPSFLWMMYRCGWATKPGQQRVLAVDITRTGFEWALAHACLSHYDRDHHRSHDEWVEQLRTSPVRIQWDPERSLRLGELPHRSLQVGIGGPAVSQYVDEWLVGITDVTATARQVKDLLDTGDDEGAAALLPDERPYPLPGPVAATIGADAPA